MSHIADSIRETGNDPHDQLFGSITTAYITRHNNVRELILSVDKKEIKQFVKELKN